MENADDLVEAIKAMKDAGGRRLRRGHVITADPSTCWRFFSMVYSGLAGPLVTDQGTTVDIDRDAMEESFAFLQSLTGDQKLMPSNATATTSSSLFSQGKVGFLFDGVWQIPTYRAIDGLKFNVEPFPALLGPKPAAYADSHSMVIPASSSRPESRTADAVDFVKGLLDESATWADGGHVPAWLPVQESQEFKTAPASEQLHAGRVRRGLRPGGLVHRRRLGLPDGHGVGDRRRAERRHLAEERSLRDDLQPADLLHRPPTCLEVTR